MRVQYVTALALATLALSCQRQQIPAQENYMTEELRSDLRKLTGIRVFFGHQSVGENILQGLEELYEQTDLMPPPIIALTDDSLPDSLPSSCLLHKRIGENREPEEKIADFAATLRRLGGTPVDVALMKLCYVDITEETDYNNLYTGYVSSMEQLGREFDSTTILHATAPLHATTGNPNWRSRYYRYKIRRFFGLADPTDPSNAVRCAYNQLVRGKYRERLFDIAAVESTYPDGSREGFTYQKQTCYSLIHGYTKDGGHLNKAGRIRVASAFVRAIVSALE